MTMSPGDRVRWEQARGRWWWGYIVQHFQHGPNGLVWSMVRVAEADNDQSSDEARFHVLLMPLKDLLPDKPPGPSSRPS